MAQADRRRISLLLAAATLIPILVSSWLGLRVLRQDRQAERQRLREQLEVVAGRLALDIDRRLRDIETNLAQGGEFAFTRAGIASAPGAEALLYQPIEIASVEPSSAVFAAAEADEFRRGHLDAAAAAYLRLAPSPAADVRAGALVRLARVLRKRGERDAALLAYADLAQLDKTIVAGQPAALVAQQGICRVLEESGDRDRLHAEATRLAAILQQGGWPIDRATFESYLDLLSRWGIPAPSPAAVARTDATIRLWQSWQRGDLPARGRRVLADDQMPLLAVWDGGSDRTALWIGDGGEVEEQLRPLWVAGDLAVAAVDTEGRRIFGEPMPGAVSLTPAESRLPFILSVASMGRPAGGSSGRTALVATLAGAFLLMVAAAYGLSRATERELRLAHQQSEFVSAVSHEFRTPLTSMRHLIDLLVRHRAVSEERRNEYYELLAGETDRLHRMVESLLSFGRIEAGAYAWRLEPLDPGALVHEVADEFRREPSAGGRSITDTADSHLPMIRGDHEALKRALWNLLENAVKYSPAATPIQLFARTDGDLVCLGVRDEGPGISADEQRSIFQKFVRGVAARQDRVPGIGIGLALVRRIVEAHGGSVDVESEPGAGSTFVLTIPGAPLQAPEQVA